MLFKGISFMNEKVKKLKRNMEQRIVGKGDVIHSHSSVRRPPSPRRCPGGREDVPRKGIGGFSLPFFRKDPVHAGYDAVRHHRTIRLQPRRREMQSEIAKISIHDDLTAYAVNIVDATRNKAEIKTQSALLEVMEEHKVTIDGKEQLVPEPFMVIGTQNPAEMAGAYPLPESQLDRFMIRLSVGYPDPKASEDMAKRFLAGQLHDVTHPVLTARDVREMQSEIAKISIHDDLTAYAVNIVDATRNKAEPEDIASAAALTLPHRLVLSSGARLSRVTGEDMIAKILSQTKVQR